MLAQLHGITLVNRGRSPSPELLARLREVQNANQVAREFGLSRSRTSAIAKQHGIVLPNRGRPAGRTLDLPLVKQAERMYEAGCKVSTIAQATGRSVDCICKWRRQFGWPPRGGTAKPPSPTDWPKPRAIVPEKGPERWCCCGQRQAVGACRVCGVNPGWLEEVA